MTIVNILGLPLAIGPLGLRTIRSHVILLSLSNIFFFDFFQIKIETFEMTTLLPHASDSAISDNMLWFMNLN